jgi:hypothetical protein
MHVRDFYSINIGFHSLFGQQPIRAERIKEIANVCIHGCPDCISIGNKCSVGGYKEKYQISKSLLDEYFMFLTTTILGPKIMSNLVHKPLAPLSTWVQILALEYHNQEQQHLLLL